MSSTNDGCKHRYNYLSYMMIEGKVVPTPELLTEDELAIFLRLPQISKSSNYHNVIKNLIRMRDLPRIQISNKILFPRQAILEWVEKQTTPI